MTAWLRVGQGVAQAEGPRMSSGVNACEEERSDFRQHERIVQGLACLVMSSTQQQRSKTAGLGRIHLDVRQ